MSSAVPQNNDRRAAVRFIVLLGIVSLLADITYEGARAITGPFLATLGASAAVVGFVSGFGELVGYSLRIVSGLITDRTRGYWTMTILGYAVNLLAVPIMALAGHWEVAAALMVAERLGKAIRTPPRDAMLSYATGHVGAGWGFGLHEAMDQIGALMGPLIVSAVLFVKGGYRAGFIGLAIPAVLAITVVIVARFIYPDPTNFEIKRIRIETHAWPRRYWFYLAAVAAIAAGYADFPLIAYHFEKAGIASKSWIPLLYSIAMGVDALSALFFGRLFDYKGISVLMVVAAISAFFAPLVFLGGFGAAIVGMIVWGIGMGAQESVMRAAVAEMVAPERRGSAYGVFNMGYGLFWFAGSFLMGVLYGISIPTLVVFSMAMQLLAIPILYVSKTARP